jgi:uncharacterized protein (TIGR03437 family)
MDITDDRRITVGFSTQAQAFDQLGAVASAGFCRFYDIGTGIAQLSADGSRLIRSTMLDGCGFIRVASGDTSIHSASPDNAPDALVLRVPAGFQSGPRIDRISNAFSGTGHGVAPGELVAIYGAELGPAEPIDLGLNAKQDLPLELGGTQVFFDGVPAPMLRAGASQLIVVAPDTLDARAATVEVVAGGRRANEVLVPVIPFDPALLPRSFPATEPGVTLQANARNADGSLNGPDNPAAPGSIVWVFATGLGRTDPPAPAGAIARSDSVRPTTLFRDGSFAPLTGVRSMTGFVSSLFAVPVRLPQEVPESGRVTLTITTALTFRGTSRRSFSAPVFIYAGQPMASMR